MHASSNHSPTRLWSLDLGRTLAACLLFALSCSIAAAFDSNRTIAQFAHTAWGPKDGAPSVVTALAQTTDGYLWLGSPDGLYRFDGVSFERYEPQLGTPLPNQPISALLAIPNGDLWIGFGTGEISLLRNGKATNYSTREGALKSAWVYGFAQDREGKIWAATIRGLERLEDNRWEKVGEDWNFPANGATSIFLDHQGTLWVSTVDELVFLSDGAKKFQRPDTRVGPAAGIVQTAKGKLWMAETTRSVHPIPLSDKRLPADDTELKVGSIAILLDNDGGLWVTTIGDGLRRAPAPESLSGKIGEFSTAAESFTVADGLSDDYVRSIFQDREGNIWVGTNSGLDRFHKTSLVTVAVPFKFNYVDAVLVGGDDGDAMLESHEDFVRLHKGRADRDHLPVPCGAMSAYRDSTNAITWICFDAIYRYQAGSYTRIAFPSFFPKMYPENSIAATGDSSGAFWLAARKKGLFYWKKGRWQQIEIPPGTEELLPATAYTDWMGRAWFGYRYGTIITIDGAKIRKSYSSSDSLVGSISIIRGRGRHIWVGGSLGLAFFDGSRFRRIVPEDDQKIGPVVGVQETTDGSLWLAERDGVVQIPATEVQHALNDFSYRVKYRRFNSFDGLLGRFAGVQTSLREIQGTDGRLWFVASRGVVWVDPADVFTNTLPPPVSIRSVTVSGRQLDSLANLTLPARTTNLEISYTALSLAVPEKVRFRYMLEGVDKGWQDAGTRREAFYTRLDPGKYHFRVVACNNDGVWNEEGARLDFGIAPAWFQTTWFRVLCVGLFLLLLWTLYQLRLKQLERQFNVAIEARVNERTRIARELHDTLLQSFNGLLLRFQAVSNLLPGRPEEAKRRVDSAIEQAAIAITEGRDAVHELRSGGLGTIDLAESIGNFARELLGHPSNDSLPKFQIQVEGIPRNLNPMVRDEAYRIAAEALRNAIRHASAQRIEAEIRYDEEQLRLRLRDDGKGIDPDVLGKEHMPGHWGLRGMRERANLIGGTFEVWSEVGSGTEVELNIPAANAYAKPAFRRGLDPRGTRRS